MTTPSTNPNCNDVLGIDDTLVESVEAYPNPFSNEIQLQTENPDLTIQMFDVLGKQVDVKLTSKKIDTTFLEYGIYFLRVKNGSSSKTFKLIKN